MGLVTDSISDWLKELFSELITMMIKSIFEYITTMFGDASTIISATPSSYNSTIFDMIQQINENVVLPIAGILMTYVVCYELITMLLEKNNMVEIDVFMIFKWFMKTFITIELVTNAFTIIMALFDVGAELVADATGVTGEIIELQATEITADVSSMSLPQVLATTASVGILAAVLYVAKIWITLIIALRFFNIYIQSSVASLPFATWGNHQLNNMGMNYLKNMLGLAFQGMFMIITISIYVVLVTDCVANLSSGGIAEFQENIPTMLIWTILLMVTLKGTDTLAKSIFDSH